MSLYRVKNVPRSEIAKLQHFLNIHWKRGHLLAQSIDLLNFQHYSAEKDGYNFIVAENTCTSEYDALVGYISTAQYDSNLKEHGDYWGAIWKIRDDITEEDLNAVGFYIWKRLFKLPHFQSYAAIGISNIAKQIYIASRISIGYLRQYYMLNNKITSFRIAGNVKQDDLIFNVTEEDSVFSLSWIDDPDWENIDIEPYYRPIKSVMYFRYRYFEHPVYKYHFMGVYKGSVLSAMLAVRIIEINNSNVIRIVDALGKLEGDLSKSFRHLLYDENAEYIDVLNYGIDESVFFLMGFKKLDFNGDLIIPNYFEPFELRNVKIELAFKCDFEYIAFKGDSDQDRPNIIG